MKQIWIEEFYKSQKAIKCFLGSKHTLKRTGIRHDYRLKEAYGKADIKPEKYIFIILDKYSLVNYVILNKHLKN